jgi:hypothetical protein
MEEEPVAWSAPVGVVTGVLLSPVGLSTVLLGPPEGGTWTVSQRDALARARAFVGALIEMASLTAHDTSALVELRRTMKKLSPVLFTAFMDRRVRGTGSR